MLTPIRWNAVRQRQSRYRISAQMRVVSAKMEGKRSAILFFSRKEERMSIILPPLRSCIIESLLEQE